MKNKQKDYKLVKISGIIAALLVIGGVLELTGVTHLLHKKPVQRSSQPTGETINYEPATPADKAQVEQNKTDDTKIKDAQSQSNPPAPAADKNVVIASAVQQESKEVVVQTQLFGTGWKTCTLTLSLGDKKITKTADTLYQPTFSTCLGFSIAYSDLNAAGDWKVDLSVTNNDGQTHTAASTTVKVTP